MKILYICHTPLPSESTDSLFTMKMCQVFHNSGHEVTLVGRSGKRSKSDLFSYYGLTGGFSIRTFYHPSNTLIKTIQLGWKIRSIIMHEKPDILYAKKALYLLLFTPSKIPIFYEMHSPSYLGEHNFLQLPRRILFMYLLRRKRIKRIIVTTRMLKHYIGSIFPDLDVVLARLSAEKPISISNDNVVKFKKGYLRGRSIFSVGYTGYLDDGMRGMDVLCKIAERMPSVDFHLIGGPQKMVEYWLRRIKAKNIYFYGRKPSNMIPYYLRTFDTVLAPLQLEKSKSGLYRGMSPFKIPQYLSYGCAIIASDIPQHRELLEDKKTAILVKDNDINAWVKAITKLKNDFEFRQRLQRNAYEAYKQGGFAPEDRVRAIFSGVEKS